MRGMLLRNYCRGCDCLHELVHYESENIMNYSTVWEYTFILQDREDSNALNKELFGQYIIDVQSFLCKQIRFSNNVHFNEQNESILHSSRCCYGYTYFRAPWFTMDEINMYVNILNHVVRRRICGNHVGWGGTLETLHSSIYYPLSMSNPRTRNEGPRLSDEIIKLEYTNHNAIGVGLYRCWPTLDIVFSGTKYLELCKAITIYCISKNLPTNVKSVLWTLPSINNFNWLKNRSIIRIYSIW